jgi:hypothetical protein
LGPLLLGAGAIRAVLPVGSMRSTATAARPSSAPVTIAMPVRPTAAPASTPAPASVAAPSATGPGGPPLPAAEERPESTRALLDRLERLADLHAGGQLDDAEFEVAKDAVLRELEARQ